MIPWLSILTFGPLLGAILLALLPEGKPKAARGIAFGVSTLVLLGALGMLIQFKPGTFHYQFTQFAPWVGSLG
ncbi:MAG: NADH-quinone oxidoreductase subunit M, partial [Caulobacteraceae bacterium]